MKNIRTLLMSLIGTIAFISSCKKDEGESTKAQLTSGKWYYDFVDNLHNAGTSSCFNESDYFEFRADGTVTSSRLGEGTYTLSDDGKTFTLNLSKNLQEEYSNWTGTIHLVKSNYLRLSIIAVRNIHQEYGYEVTLAQERSHQYCYIK